MSSAREDVLERVHRALAARARVVPAEASYRRTGSRPKAELVGLLAERISAYRATVHRSGPADVAAAVFGICERRNVRRLGLPRGLPDEWRPARVEIVEDDGLAPAELDALDGVLTGCELAIAETGTLALAGGAAQGRRALTLVPDLHVCVVLAEQIVELVPEAIAHLGRLVRETRRPLTLVSGPSATSDIELERVEGVHGPRTLEVIIVESGG